MTAIPLPTITCLHRNIAPKPRAAATALRAAQETPMNVTRQMERQFKRKASAAAKTRMREVMAAVDKLSQEQRECLSDWLAKNPGAVIDRKSIPLILSGAI